MVSEGVLCSNDNDWEKKSSHGRAVDRDLADLERKDPSQ